MWNVSIVPEEAHQIMFLAYLRSSWGQLVPPYRDWGYCTHLVETPISLQFHLFSLFQLLPLLPPPPATATTSFPTSAAASIFEETRIWIFFFLSFFDSEVMSKSKEEILWQACTDGDLEVAKELADNPAVNVNWGDPEYGRGPFYRACFYGKTNVVGYLMRNPRVDVMKPNKNGATSLFLACQEGHPEVVSLLLADPRIDPNMAMNNGTTPFSVACQEGHPEVVSLLLADSRLDPNKPDNGQSTPLWQASQYGHLVIVQHLLASEREIDTRTRSSFNNTTAAEQGRGMGTRRKENDETEEVFRRSLDCGPLCADLIDEYERDPTAVKNRLRCRPGLREFFIGHLFALVVFHSDNFVVTNEKTAGSFTKRFFKIVSQLPLDIQMVLCNRIFESPKDIILSRDSEAWFQTPRPIFLAINSLSPTFLIPFECFVR